MTEEKRLILDRIDELIAKRKFELLKGLPSIHEIDDGIIIRFFTDWDNCHSNELIRYKKIINFDNLEDTTIFYFLPKGAEISLIKRPYIKCMSCLSGRLEINDNGKTHILTGFKKLCLETDEFNGVALEDSYVLTTCSALATTF